MSSSKKPTAVAVRPPAKEKSLSLAVDLPPRVQEFLDSLTPAGRNVMGPAAKLYLQAKAVDSLAAWLFAKQLSVLNADENRHKYGETAVADLCRVLDIGRSTGYALARTHECFPDEAVVRKLLSTPIGKGGSGLFLTMSHLTALSECSTEAGRQKLLAQTISHGYSVRELRDKIAASKPKGGGREKTDRTDSRIRLIRSLFAPTKEYDELVTKIPLDLVDKFGEFEDELSADDFTLVGELLEQFDHILDQGSQVRETLSAIHEKAKAKFGSDDVADGGEGGEAVLTDVEISTESTEGDGGGEGEGDEGEGDGEVAGEPAAPDEAPEAPAAEVSAPARKGQPVFRAPKR